MMYVNLDTVFSFRKECERRKIKTIYARLEDADDEDATIQLTACNNEACINANIGIQDWKQSVPFYQGTVESLECSFEVLEGSVGC